GTSGESTRTPCPSAWASSTGSSDAGIITSLPVLGDDRGSRMKIVVAGGTGFLGRPLVQALSADGHEVVVLTRGRGSLSAANTRAALWNPDGSGGPWTSEIDGAAAVINLAGESIAARRWTDAHKQRVLDSR